MLLCDGAQWRERAASCIGEEDIDLRVLLLDGIVEPVDVGEVRHVASDACDTAADRLHRCVQRVLPATRDARVNGLRPIS
ncbi:hypothetical protein GCM10007036_30620 [Alsobacter metallidurans]|uniref:Uncharacterized protein n=1 Tax=Alsobacter metallidurans TaxID=340221 RepID=A0A917IA08_9HYPH|nr:hypothetical protein GCM10007036_30620 [Alsobacter metallidurans]